MNITASLFYFFEAVAAISALGLLFTRNVFYGALLVIVCLLALAGIYVLAFAEFVAVTQILIYAGGILIIILFGIMLTSKISGKPLAVKNGNYFAGILVASAIFISLVYCFHQASFPPLQPPVHDTIKPIGLNLMTEFLLPFEIAGILLLVSLIGAAVTATSTKLKSDVPD